MASAAILCLPMRMGMNLGDLDLNTVSLLVDPCDIYIVIIWIIRRFRNAASFVLTFRRYSDDGKRQDYIYTTQSILHGK